MTLNLIQEKKRLQELLEYAWLELGDTSGLELKNPLKSPFLKYKDDPARALLWFFKQPQYFGFTCKHLLNVELLPFQLAALHEMWIRTFPLIIWTRGGSKSYMLGLYTILRLLFNQGCKVIITGAGFRQSKIVFEYAETIWHNAPMLRNIVGSHGGNDRKNGPRRDVDRAELIIGNSVASALPVGDGSKIRGLRANFLIVDEFQAADREVFETVLSGFAAVSSSPVESVKHAAKIKVLKDIGVPLNEDSDDQLFRNQTILSGTCTYQFGHLYDYWKRYKAIVESKGDIQKLQEIFNGAIPPKFDWTHYSIMRIPAEMLPPNFMDQTHLAKSQATMFKGIYEQEYGACFLADSNGFYKRSMIEKCVTKEPIPVNGMDIQFSADVKGNKKNSYVFAIDPASERDNFSIVIIENWADHRRIVYCWTVTRSLFKEKQKKGYTQEQDFYRYCVRKIRDLMRVFPCERIGIDTQGGGFAIIEGLHDDKSMEEGEKPIWPVIDPEKERDEDDYPGLHIIEEVVFSNANWVVQANHSLRKDLEDKLLLFPKFDPITLSNAAEEDAKLGREYDTVEDCVWNIEELKDELATIVHTQTTNGRDRWDVPEIKLPTGKRQKLRKDRYSALLMANMIARTLQQTPYFDPNSVVAFGGFADKLRVSEHKSSDPGELYLAPAWWNEGMKNNDYGVVVSRK